MSKTQDEKNERKRRHEFTSNVTDVVFSELEKHLKGSQSVVKIAITTGKYGRDRLFTISNRRGKINIRIFNNGNVDIIVTELAFDNFRILLTEYDKEIDSDSTVDMLRKGIELFIGALFKNNLHDLMDFMADTCLGAKWEDCMNNYLESLHDAEDYYCTECGAEK